MLVQHKSNKELVIKVLSTDSKMFTGKIVESSGAWKKGETGRNFAIKDFDIIKDLGQFLSISEQLREIVRYNF